MAFIDFLSNVHSGKASTKSALAGFDKHSSQSGHPEMFKHDFFTAAIVSGNMELVKWCIRQNFDIFVQGVRFCPLNESAIYKHNEKNKVAIDYVSAILLESDHLAATRYIRAQEKFARKTPGCTCNFCSGAPALEPPVVLPSNHSTANLLLLKEWIAQQQRQGAIPAGHRNDVAEFNSELNAYLKYRNRRV